MDANSEEKYHLKTNQNTGLKVQKCVRKTRSSRGKESSSSSSSSSEEESWKKKKTKSSSLKAGKRSCSEAGVGEKNMSEFNRIVKKVKYGDITEEMGLLFPLCDSCE